MQSCMRQSAFGRQFQRVLTYEVGHAKIKMNGGRRRSKTARSEVRLRADKPIHTLVLCNDDHSCPRAALVPVAGVRGGVAMRKRRSSGRGRAARVPRVKWRRDRE